VVACLYLFVGFWFSTIVVAWLVMQHLNETRRPPPPFVEPIIWRIPHTGGEPRIQFDI
jgi:hypothetical protein